VRGGANTGTQQGQVGVQGANAGAQQAQNSGAAHQRQGGNAGTAAKQQQAGAAAQGNGRN
jgi:hypothetical protein